MRRRRWLIAYLLLVVLSAMVQTLRSGSSESTQIVGSTQRDLAVSVKAPSGKEFPASLHVIEWNANSADQLPPVILLHGSPGSASDFARLAPLLAQNGRHVLAIDLLGFGRSSPWVPNYSIRANASALESFMERTGIARAHVLGWSNGGGVAMCLADAAPDRVASLTLLGSIGLQKFEGSGNYTFEHFKYALAAIAFVIAPETVPHFGLLGSREMRHAFVRFFWDSDQRPMGPLMERLTTPTLVYHGRHDILVPARAAEAHASLISGSRLVMIDANHFIPFTHPETAAGDILRFFSTHDQPGIAPVGGIEDRSFVVSPNGIGRTINRLRTEIRRLPWWADTATISKGVLLFPALGVVITALFVTGIDIDPVVGCVGIAAGMLGQTFLVIGLRAVLGRRAERLPIVGKRIAASSSRRWHARLTQRPFHEGYSGAFIHDERTTGLFAAASVLPFRRSALFGIGRVIGLVVWAAAALVSAMVAIVIIVSPLKHALGLVGSLLGIGCAMMVVRTLPMLLVSEGRCRIWRSLRRAIRLEFWPGLVFYLPLLTYGVPLAFRKGHLWIVCCCNPGIDHAGGVVGESKSSILASLGESPFAARTLFLPAAGADERVQTLGEWMNRHSIAWPVVLKPDEGQRGFAVKLVHTESEAGAYFTHVRAAVVAQPYVPGPHECGILWARSLKEDGTLDESGSIFSITRKTFPEVTGDGEHTLEELIAAHPRHSLQAPVFAERFPIASRMLPDRGEIVRIGVAGNHCQGTQFSDGEDLITPELTRAISELALRFDGGFDYGRFDVRYTDDEALRKGEGFCILELNGISSESTNIYDPKRSAWWAYGVFFRQWRTMMNLGVARRKTGIKPPTTGDLIRMTRSHFRTRTGSAIAD
ncbi:MAG: alpha/beta fold hydrolase [bacterium]|nr:alpha/beta fold hydrolase [bacterium]